MICKLKLEHMLEEKRVAIGLGIEFFYPSFEFFFFFFIYFHLHQGCGMFIGSLML